MMSATKPAKHRATIVEQLWNLSIKIDTTFSFCHLIYYLTIQI